MAEEKSMIVFEGAREGQQKFDYFVAGLTGALFAYIAQTYVPEKFGFDPAGLEPLALLFLAVSFFLALKRIELTNIIMRLNHDMLAAAEKAGNMTKALASHTGDGFNAESGEIVPFRDLPARRQNYMLQAQAAEHALLAKISKSERYYTYRNHFLIAGFAAIFLAKLLQPYL